MANETAWQDRLTMLSLFKNLQGCFDNFIIFAREAEKFKTEVLDDSERKAELQKLINEDPKWSMTKIIKKYNEFKAIYEHLKQL